MSPGCQLGSWEPESKNSPGAEPWRSDTWEQAAREGGLASSRLGSSPGAGSIRSACSAIISELRCSEPVTAPVWWVGGSGGLGVSTLPSPIEGKRGEAGGGGECLVASGRPLSIASSQSWQFSPKGPLQNEHKHDLLLTLHRCCKPKRDVVLPGAPWSL